MTLTNKNTGNLDSRLREVLYHLFESGGANAKYIREDHIGNPISPDQALDQIKAVVSEEVIGAERKAYNAVILGYCPSCGGKVKDWVAPSGSFAPEAYATLRENGINPSTGHKENCQLERASNVGGSDE